MIEENQVSIYLYMLYFLLTLLNQSNQFFSQSVYVCMYVCIVYVCVLYKQNKKYIKNKIKKNDFFLLLSTFKN